MQYIYKFTLTAALALQTLSLWADELPVAPDTIQLHDVVVEASKMGLRLKRLPASVSLLSGEGMQRLGLLSVPSLSLVMPNLFMGDYGSKLTSPIYVRGIGSRINAPSVGMYVDHVPYYDKSAMHFDLYDISRIELLRGPQGTEYGRNAMGGILNIRTKSPLDYQGLDVRLQAATYGDFSASAGLYVRPSRAFAYSLSAQAIHRDGFFINKHRDQRVDNLRSYALRNRINYLPSDQLSLEHILSLEHSDQGGYPYAPYDQATKTISPIAYDAESGYRRTMLSDALVVKYRGEGTEIVSSTSFQYFKDKQYIDQDFTPRPLVFVEQWQRQYLLSQDISLKHWLSDNFSLLVGAHAFYQDLDHEVWVGRLAQRMTDRQRNHARVAGNALYIQAVASDWLLPGFTLTAGLRLDSERDLLTHRHDLELPGQPLRTKADKQFRPQSFLELLPKLALSYRLGHHNAYATVARGYKTGGFNISFDTEAHAAFAPEYSWNYEVGLKSSWLEQHLYSELSLFYIDWRDQQIYQSIPTGGAMLLNAGRSRSRGLELSLRTAPIYGFELIGAYGLTDARFVTNRRDGKTDHSGKRLPYAPQNTASLELRKTIEFSSKSPIRSIALSALYRGAGPIYYDEANALRQGYYSLLSARLSLEHRLVRLELWGDNLTNTNYLAHYFAFALGRASQSYAQPGKPLQLGARLSFHLF